MADRDFYLFLIRIKASNTTFDQSNVKRRGVFMTKNSKFLVHGKRVGDIFLKKRSVLVYGKK